MMPEQECLLMRLKAEAFDRILKIYKDLDSEDAFYSQNWVELSEVIESELKRIQWIRGQDQDQRD